MGDSYEGEPAEQIPIYPQPQAGLLPSQNLEVVRELIKNQRFRRDPEKSRDDPESIIEGDHPGEKDDQYWAVYNKDFVLSSLSEMEIDIIRLLLKSQDCLVMVSQSEKNLSLKDLIDENQQEILGIVKTSRARDGFERKMINTSTQQTIVGNISPQNGGGGMRNTVANGLGRIFGFGGMTR